MISSLTCGADTGRSAIFFRLALGLPQCASLSCFLLTMKLPQSRASSVVSASALGEAFILVVDDGSPDGTAKIAADFGDRYGQVEVLSRPSKMGLGSAYRDGFRWGLERGYEAFVEMDSDFSHDPDSLPSIVAPLENGYEVCIGSRYVKGGSIPNWSFPRRMLSRGGNIYADLLLGLGVKDSTAGFRAYSAAVLGRIDLSRCGPRAMASRLR